MARVADPERVRRVETDKSVFSLEDVVDEIWGDAQREIEVMKVLPGLQTHRLDWKLGNKRIRLLPERHSIPMSDGAVAGVKWDEKGGYWNLAEMKKTWGEERFTVRTVGDNGFSIVIEPARDDQFWMNNVLWRLIGGLVSLDEEKLPFGEPVETQKLGGVFEMSLDRNKLEFCAVYAGEELLDPIHYQLELNRSDSACQHLCEPMVRLLIQVFGKPGRYAI